MKILELQQEQQQLFLRVRPSSLPSARAEDDVLQKRAASQPVRVFLFLTRAATYAVVVAVMMVVVVHLPCTVSVHTSVQGSVQPGTLLPRLS